MPTFVFWKKLDNILKLQVAIIGLKMQKLLVICKVYSLVPHFSSLAKNTILLSERYTADFLHIQSLGIA